MAGNYHPIASDRKVQRYSVRVLNYKMVRECHLHALLLKLIYALLPVSKHVLSYFIFF